MIENNERQKIERYKQRIINLQELVNDMEAKLAIDIVTVNTDKLFSPTHLVHTEFGYKQANELNENDRVYDHNGELFTITEISK